MTLEEFRRLAGAWGADIERWPEAARASARELASTQAGAEVLAAARDLDVVLERRPAVSRARADNAAHAVTLRIAEENDRRHKSEVRWWWSSWLVPAGSLACSALVGISLAMLVPPDSPEIMAQSAILDTGSMASGWTLQ
jgi:hypothetical protein